MKNYHMCMSVRGALRKPRKQLKGMLLDDNGRSLSADETFEALMDELANGHKKMPLGDCNNFDYKHKGCMGHEQKEETEPSRPAERE